jgi:hypothetical protein
VHRKTKDSYYLKWNASNAYLISLLNYNKGISILAIQEAEIERTAVQDQPWGKKFIRPYLKQ